MYFSIDLHWIWLMGKMILPGNSIVCFEEFQRVPEWREVKGTDLRAFLTRFDHIIESRKRRYQASCLLWAASRTEMTSLREAAVQLIITLPRSPVVYILLMSSAVSANDSCTCPETHTWTITTDRQWPIRSSFTSDPVLPPDCASLGPSAPAAPPPASAGWHDPTVWYLRNKTTYFESVIWINVPSTADAVNNNYWHKIHNFLLAWSDSNLKNENGGQKARLTNMVSMFSPWPRESIKFHYNRQNKSKPIGI